MGVVLTVIWPGNNFVIIYHSFKSQTQSNPFSFWVSLDYERKKRKNLSYCYTPDPSPLIQIIHSRHSSGNGHVIEQTNSLLLLISINFLYDTWRFVSPYLWNWFEYMVSLCSYSAKKKRIKFLWLPYAMTWKILI